MCYLFLYPDEEQFKDYKFEVLNPGKNNQYFGYKLYGPISDNQKTSIFTRSADM